jgi:hypothetical protein
MFAAQLRAPRFDALNQEWFEAIGRLNEVTKCHHSKVAIE